MKVAVEKTFFANDYHSILGIKLVDKYRIKMNYLMKNLREKSMLLLNVLSAVER